MPLRPHEKASLALRIVSARFLDDFVLPNQVKAEEMGLAWVRAAVQCSIAKACSKVKSHADIANYLKAEADALYRESLSEDDLLSNDLKDVVHKWSDALIHVAGRIQPNDGDGPATDDSKPPCSCGFLDVAAEIERRVDNAYSRATALVDTRPAINYKTYLRKDLAPQDWYRTQFEGSACIDTWPRLVQIKVSGEGFGARDLCHLVYLLHHELICHVYQNLGDPTLQRENSPVEDHWSEGWMDKCAFDLAKAWVEETRHHWLLVENTDATEAMGYYHMSRYDDNVLPKRIVGIGRRAARAAFEKLGDAFLANKFATNRAEAENLVRKFSLLANAHPNATYPILKRIGTRLQDHLLTKYRSHAAKLAAVACMEFINKRQLHHLVDSLEEALDQ